VYLLIIDTLPYWRIMMSKIMNQDKMKELAAELAKLVASLTITVGTTAAKIAMDIALKRLKVTMARL
jgi:hypothetical protein